MANGEKLDNTNPSVETEQIKTFTQEELDVIIAKRINEVKKQLEADYNERLREREAELLEANNEVIPNLLAELEIESVDAIRELQASSQELKAEVETYKGKEALAQKRELVKELGVHDDFVEYVINSVVDGDYENFVKDKPRILAGNYVDFDSNPRYNGTHQPASADLLDTPNTEEYLKARRAEDKKGE